MYDPSSLPGNEIVNSQVPPAAAHIAVELLKLSLDEWLTSRKPTPPDALLARMRAEIQKLGLSEADITTKALADAGASILKSLDKDGCTDRAAALDLLAADALFTYAFEAAADSRTEIEEASRYVLEKVTKT